MALLRARLHLFGFVLSFLFASTFAAAAVPNPTVTGPIPSKAPPGDPSHNYPWLATGHNLAAVGYVEEEYFYEGTANRYVFPATAPVDTPPTVATVQDSGHPYRTRMIVRRPVSPAKFNGTVIVEWQNVTAGYDLDAMWGASYEHFLREGYVWVGVSAQRVGVDQIKTWSPARYGTLDVTQGGTVGSDALSYDIFAQALQAIKSPVGVNPLGQLQARKIIVTGASQSGGYLQRIINNLHPLYGSAKTGGPTDAYLVYISGGVLNTHLDVPVWKLISETDVAGQVASRQPDTATYRSWEVAGATHSGRRTALNSRPLVARDGWPLTGNACTYPIHPRVPVQHVTNAVYDHLVRWIADPNYAPPHAEPIATIGTTIVRDADNNALGGVRLPEMLAPTAWNAGTGNSDADGTSTFCRLYGTYLPFTQQRLDALYPNHGSYVSQTQAAIQTDVKGGLLVPADASLTQYMAAHSIVGQAACSSNGEGSACFAARDLVEMSYFYLWTTGQVEQFMAQASDIMQTVARAEASGGKKGGSSQAAYTSVRRDLQRYIDSVRALQAQGSLSAVSANELAAGAQAVLTALP